MSRINWPPKPVGDSAHCAKVWSKWLWLMMVDNGSWCLRFVYSSGFWLMTVNNGWWRSIMVDDGQSWRCLIQGSQTHSYLGSQSPTTEPTSWVYWPSNVESSWREETNPAALLHFIPDHPTNFQNALLITETFISWTSLKRDDSESALHFATVGRHFHFHIHIYK